MKHAKKLISLLLALVMVLSMSVTAFAAQEGTLTGGSITINDAVVGQKYSIYQILYLESYNSTDNAYAYKANSAWSDWLKTQTDYVAIDDQGYVTWAKKDGEGNEIGAAEFAKAAQKYAKDNNITPDATIVTAESTTVEFENLNLGYYLVDTTLGTLCSLDTTNPSVTMEEKNQAPTNVKTVEEDSTGDYGEKDDADIGQTVNFKSTVTLPAGSENIVFHDTMSAGLSLDKTEGKIKVYTDANMTTELDSGNYTVNTNPAESHCTFEVSFTQTYLDSLTETATVYVKYSATVNANAVIGGEGNPNTSKLSYGDSTNTKYTPDSKTTTYVWEFNIFKYTAKGEEKKPLQDAKFVLLNSDRNKIATIVNGKITGWVNVPTAGTDGTVTWPANTELTSDPNGKIEIVGLDSDTYFLRETKAPAGYNKLKEDVQVIIDNQGKVNPDETGNGVADNTVEVLNETGAELPSTGGMGTTIFYVVGSILLVGAAVLLITKKRMSAAR